MSGFATRRGHDAGESRFFAGHLPVAAATLLAIGALVAGRPAMAGGFNLDHQNAAAVGAAFAGAEATRAETAFATYNPAAIDGAGRVSVAGALTGIFPDSGYSQAEATLLGASSVAGQTSDDATTEATAVPNFSLSVSPIEKLSLGLVVNTPFGLDTDYSRSSVARYQAQRSALLAVEVTPMAAYEFWPGFVAGVGVRVQYVDLSLSSIIDAGGIASANGVPGFAPGSSDLAASFDGDDTAVGYVLGLQASPHRLIDLGVSYSSAIEHQIHGNSSFKLGSSLAGQTLNSLTGIFGAENFKTKLDTPATLAIGIRINASDRLRILFSERVMFWSTLDLIALSFDDAATPTEVVTQSWRDSTMTSVGIEFDVLEGTTLRGGYMYDESPVRGKFATPRVPDSDRHWISFGVSHALSESLIADLGIAYAVFEERNIRLSGALPENAFRGSLDAETNASAVGTSLGLRYRF